MYRYPGIYTENQGGGAVLSRLFSPYNIINKLRQSPRMMLHRLLPSVECWCWVLMSTVDVNCWCWLLMSTVDANGWCRLLMPPVDANCWCQLLMLTVDANCLMSTVYHLPSTIYCLPYADYQLLSTVYRLLPTVYCLLSTVYCLLSTVYCLLSSVYCLLSTVFHLLSLFSILSVTSCLKSVSKPASKRVLHYKRVLTHLKTIRPLHHLIRVHIATNNLNPKRVVEIEYYLSKNCSFVVPESIAYLKTLWIYSCTKYTRMFI